MAITTTMDGYRLSFYSRLPKFGKAWFLTSIGLSASNILFGKSNKLQVLEDRAKYYPYNKLDIIDRFGWFSAKCAISAFKGFVMGCPIIFVPNMTYRLAKFTVRRDANYLKPPFYYDAHNHSVLQFYTFPPQQ